MYFTIRYAEMVLVSIGIVCYNIQKYERGNIMSAASRKVFTGSSGARKPQPTTEAKNHGARKPPQRPPLPPKK